MIDYYEDVDDFREAFLEKFGVDLGPYASLKTSPDELSRCVPDAFVQTVHGYELHWLFEYKEDRYWVAAFHSNCNDFVKLAACKNTYFLVPPTSYGKECFDPDPYDYCDAVPCDNLWAEKKYFCKELCDVVKGATKERKAYSKM